MSFPSGSWRSSRSEDHRRYASRALDGGRVKEASASAVELLTAADTVRYFSAASAWEMAVKWRLGKLPLPDHPKIWVGRMMRELALEALPVQHVHAVRVADLPDHHRDPFDRILIAQAQVEGAVVATSDKLLSKYDIEVLPAA